MNNGFVLLTEKEAMWAEMLMEVLKDNDIPCAAEPVYGAGFTVRTGVKEWLKIYVPEEELEKAKDLYEILFSSESIRE